MTSESARSFLGFGLGLRPQHYEAVLSEETGVDWFEAVTENYLVPGGKPLHYLESVRSRFPVVLHGVSLSIAGTDPIDFGYLDEVKALARWVEPAWISDHLCWTGVDGRNMHDLLPFPHTEQTLRHVAARVEAVQDHLGRPLMLENVSSYVSFADSAMSEAEFLRELAQRTDCLLLLDVNNVHVSAVNHDFDARGYIDRLPARSVWQIHLAGHSRQGEMLIDTHDAPVPEPVWALYEHAARRLGPVSTMIERDDDIPSLQVLAAELDRARRIALPLWERNVA
ncbi:DUF692 domain-containing protein [Ectothiorhodospiraceae bacterium WFHF3C12]|nr:DUF692 domain-containing protein [Ectothiorhodospiraceae bacterium WFHF3C12]